MKKPQLLLDLGKINNPNVGLGQVSIHFSKELMKRWEKEMGDKCELVLALPKNNSQAAYHPFRHTQLNFLGRYSSGLNHSYQLWHSLHQDSEWIPNLGTKYILTIHDLNFIYEKGLLKSKYKLLQLKRKIKRADVIVTISEFTRSEVLKYFPKSEHKIQVIYNGVNPPDFEKVQKPRKLLTDNNYILSLGHLSPKKNIITLIEMLKYIPGKSLVIAGEDRTPYGDELKKYIKERNIHNINFIGAVSEAEKNYLYMHCEAFAFPSLYEGFGLPVIEAMHCGKPVFVSSKTSLPEIAGGHASIWKDFEAQQMAELYINDLAQDSAIKQEERKLYARNFSWEENVKRYLEIYKGLI